MTQNTIVEQLSEIRHPGYQTVRFRWRTPVMFILYAISLNGIAVILWRFLFGLSSVTHLDNYYAWGIWKAIGVASFVALSAGGFTTAAFIDVFYRTKYEYIKRTALVMAMLGYTFAVIGLFIDLGRYYNIWHPILPSMWSGHSALFEVAMCVMAYLIVLYIEFIPVIADRFRAGIKLPGFMMRFAHGIESTIKKMDSMTQTVLPFFIILGVVLSCMHQSALGSLMLIAPTKMNALWYTPILPLLFLLSAISAGFPAVILALLITAKTSQKDLEILPLSRLARMASIPFGMYLAAKLLDLSVRNQFSALTTGSVDSILFLIEVGLFGFVPLILLFTNHVRSQWGLILVTSGQLAGIVLNRINVYLTAFTSPNAHHYYFPSYGEISVTLALISIVILVFRTLHTIFPMFPVSSEH